MTNWMKILQDLEPINKTEKLADRIYNMLRKAAEFTPDTADDFKEEQHVLNQILRAHLDFKEHPPPSHEGFGDMFGRYYELSNQTSERAGQFFTPMNVVRVMTEISMGELTHATPMQYAGDPAAGCGRMMLKFAELYQKKLGYYNFIYNNVDIDKRMYTCCTMNAILYSIPSVTIWGNSISNEYWEGFMVIKDVGMPTTWHYLDKEAVQKFKVKFKRAKQGLDHFIEGDVDIPKWTKPERPRNTPKPAQKTLFG